MPGMVVRYEYRVVWQRQGQAKKRFLYQTLQGAERCAKRQITAAQEMDWLPFKLAPLIYEPIIESREVGEWLFREWS